jgi:hypothetical protein
VAGGAAVAGVGAAAGDSAAADKAATSAQGIFWLGAIWFVSAYALVSLSMTKFHHYVLPAIPGLAICIGCYLDDLLSHRGRRRALLLALLGLPLLALVTVDLVSAKSAAQRFLWLFSYDYIQNAHGRPWPESLDFSGTLLALAVAFAVGTLALLLDERRRRWAAAAMCGVALVATVFLLDRFMPAVAPFWSQKDVIAAYYSARRSPDERLIAYQMYWRGETFYTENEIYEGPMEERTVFDMEGSDDKLRAYLTRHRGRRIFFLCEKGQKGHIESLLPPETRGSLRVIHDSNNKFALLQADL